MTLLLLLLLDLAAEKNTCRWLPLTSSSWAFSGEKAPLWMHTVLHTGRRGGKGGVVTGKIGVWLKKEMGVVKGVVGRGNHLCHLVSNGVDVLN